MNIMVRPERLLRGLRPLGLRFAPARRRAMRVDVQLGRRRPSCRTPSGLRPWEFELGRRMCGAREGFSCTEYIGAPGEIRTPDLLVRSQALYPTELRAHTSKHRQQNNVPIRGWSTLRQSPCSTTHSLEASASYGASIPPLAMGAWWRRGRDSNPRWAFDPYALSRGAPSTTRPPLPSGNAQNRARDDTRGG